MKTKHELRIKSLKHLKYDLETYTNQQISLLLKQQGKKPLKTSNKKNQEQMQKFGWQDKEPNPK